VVLIVRKLALQAYDRLSKPVLVQCSAGMDRTAPVAAYLCVHKLRFQIRLVLSFWKFYILAEPPNSHFGLRWLELDTMRFSRAQLGTHSGYFEGILKGFWRRLNGRKPLSDDGLELVPGGGIEPSTHGFSDLQYTSANN